VGRPAATQVRSNAGAVATLGLSDGGAGARGVGSDGRLRAGKGRGRDAPRSRT
jgi:hypothetical protein